MKQDNWFGLAGGAVRPSAPHLSVIVPSLLVGEYPRPDDLAWLRDTHGVSAIVCLQDDADLASKRLRLTEIEAGCRAVGLAFFREPIPDGDSEALALRIPTVVARINALVAAGARVYLHCNAGYNRAPTVAIAYLHMHAGLGLEEATALVKERRSCVPYVSALRACFPPRDG